MIRQTTVSFTTINVYMNTGKLELQFELGYSLLEYWHTNEMFDDVLALHLEITREEYMLAMVMMMQ